MACYTPSCQARLVTRSFDKTNYYFQDDERTIQIKYQTCGNLTEKYCYKSKTEELGNQFLVISRGEIHKSYSAKR